MPYCTVEGTAKMRIRTKRIWAAGIILILAASTANACGNVDDNPSGGVGQNRPTGEIHVFAFGDAAASAEKAAADRFNKTSHVKVVVDTGPASGVEYNAAVRDSIASSTAPDIFMSWGAAGIRPLVNAGALLPLNEFIKEDPQLRDSYIPSVFKEEVIDGTTFGIPMRGVSPEFLFYNKTILSHLGLKPATTLDELQRQIGVLAAAGVTPIGLGGADKWPQMLWFQYIYSRVMGNDAVAQGLAGDEQVWASDESRSALRLIRSLVDSGAFGKTYDSVKYNSAGSAALLRTGKTAYELQGAWHFATTVEGDPTFAGKLGWTPFPTVDGGRGLPGEIVGNLSNFYNIIAETRYPDTVREFLKELYNDQFLAEEIRLGNLPPTINAAELLQADTTMMPLNKRYLTFVVGLVAQAPNFQLSWDQAVPAEKQTAFQNATADYFNGTMDADTFIRTVQDLTN
jgi:xylobiose transport system substrate-binding protein